jgi:hypothetical protein
MIIEVLRAPKRVLYHQECYVEQKDDTVYGVLRLRDGGKCVACGKVIAAGPHSRREEEIPAKLEQLTLF